MATKKTAASKAAKTKNSLVNNINAKKKAGKSNSKKDSTISEKAYQEMENDWGKSKRNK